MDSVNINVYTTINAPVITIEESTSNIEVLSQLVDTPVTIDVTETGGDNCIDVTPIDRTVVIDATTAGATPPASPTVSGRMRLYTSIGTNTDGTIDQATITDNFDLKVDKITGYSLTKNDLTDLLRAAYDSTVSWISVNGANLINHLSNSGNPHNVTKSQVGLSEVPNIDFSNSLPTRGTSVIDFGSGNMSTELLVIGITQALTTSTVTVQVRMEATPEHPVDDLLIDPIRVMIKDLVNGVGFTIFGAMDNAPANGTYKIDWSLTN